MLEQDRDSPLLCEREQKTDLELRNTAILFGNIVQHHTNNAGASPFSLGLVLELHKITVQDIYPCGGHFREATSKVSVSGAHFTPSAPYRIPSDISDLLERGRDWPATGKNGHEDISFAAEWFHEFLQVHPFMGGNGRVSRAMLMLMLYHMGHLAPPDNILPYFESRRDAYLAALQQADTGNKRPLIFFIWRGVASAKVAQITGLLQESRLWPYVTQRLSRDARRLLTQPLYAAGLPDSVYMKTVEQASKQINKIMTKLQEQGSSLS